MNSDVFATNATGLEARTQRTARLPRCEQPLGTVALVDKDSPALGATGLSTPSPVLRLMIAQSNCFQIVEREALKPAKQARKASKKSKRREQAKTDYILTPDVISANESASALSGGVLPSTVAAALSPKVQQAEVALLMASGKTGAQVATATGKASTADSNFDAARATWSRAGEGGAYTNTEIGKTVSAAFFQAYTNLVAQVRVQQVQAIATAPVPAQKTVARR